MSGASLGCQMLEFCVSFCCWYFQMPRSHPDLKYFRVHRGYHISNVGLLGEISEVSGMKMCSAALPDSHRWRILPHPLLRHGGNGDDGDSGHRRDHGSGRGRRIPRHFALRPYYRSGPRHFRHSVRSWEDLKRVALEDTR